MTYHLPPTARWLLDGGTFQLDDLGPEVFAELGRVTWAAVHLELYADGMCSFIHPANPRVDRRSIGRKIKDALRVLSAMPAAVDREAATTWLTRAGRAIERRNSLLHAVPLVGFQPGEPPRSLLGERPRGAVPYFERPLTVESLAEVRTALIEPLGDWRDVLAGLDYRAIQAHFYADAEEGPP